MLAFIGNTYRKVGHQIIPVVSGLACVALAVGLGSSHHISKRWSVVQSETAIERQRPFMQAIVHERMEAAIQRQINEVRLEYGTRPLKSSERLARVARQYSQQMAQYRFFSHIGADGSTLLQRMQRNKIGFWVVGENLFMSINIKQPVPAAITGWLNSPGHKKVLLYPTFTETGVGIWQDGEAYYITQLFSED
jgi:uncharacterized protein YkwD